MNAILPTLVTPADLAPLDVPALETLAGELRQTIIETVSKNGGHLAPSLGVVELSIALCKVFDFTKDRIIWDVGHQAYAYKLLTGRKEHFHTLRTLDGISGFPKPDESVFDHFAVGHSSTSISAGLGMAMARDLAEKTNKVVAVIGDGSMTAGLAFEGLNQAGHLDRDLIVILNDNEMSISPNVGALSAFLSKKMSSRFMQRFKKATEHTLRQMMPEYSQDIVEYLRRSESSFRSFVTPGMLFEALHFEYLGPMDGHDMEAMVDVLEQVKELEGPVLLHVLTKKGKGYAPAEENPTYFHGVGCFEPETGQSLKALKGGSCVLPTYTEVFGQTLCQFAKDDKRIVSITAAMPEGTGLACFSENYPERFVDVGICEQHAVTFAAGLASQGYKPVVAIYSTFMQRSYDQIVHDVCLQHLPVTFCLDRGGLVGEDGPTHHGAFDLAYLRHIPNLLLMAPKDEAELQRMLATAISWDAPAAIRYPRGVGPGAPLLDDPQPLLVGEAEMLREGDDCMDCCIIALGSRVYPALEAAQALAEEGIGCAVMNARFVKPLAEAMLLHAAETYPRLLLVEEGTRTGGFSSAVLECLADHDLLCQPGAPTIKRLGLPDRFVEHGPQKILRQRLGIDRTGIERAVREMLGTE